MPGQPQEFPESVVVADRWSKVAALGVAIVGFLFGQSLTGDAQFASIVAALAAIGTRLYIPYHASVAVSDAERVPLSDHPTTGNYHHGAAGLALVLTAAVALLVFLLIHAFLRAIGVGVIVGLVAYRLLASWLPKG